MSETATRLLQQLLELPEAERLQIADQLWESVGDLEDIDHGSPQPRKAMRLPSSSRSSRMAP